MDDNSCSVIPQGQRVEYDLVNSTVTFYFGPTEATTNVTCSVNGTSSFGACKLMICTACTRPTVLGLSFVTMFSFRYKRKYASVNERTCRTIYAYGLSCEYC